MNAQAHVKEVSKVRFNSDGSYLISVGKTDRAIMIWQVLPMQTASATSTAGTSTALAVLPV